MNGRARWLSVAAGAVVITGTAAALPALLRRVEGFTVDHVEISGTHYLPAYDALKQSGITRHSNVFEDFGHWRARLLQHPLVLDARIDRQLPGTIRVAITETEPIALARTPDLVPVDERGKALPVDPAELDVPILSMPSQPNAHGVFADAATRTTVRVLAAIARRDPRLYSWVSEAGALRGDGVRLALRDPVGAEVLVPAAPAALRLRELEVAFAELAARGELPQLKRIDARYRDQIVVSLRN